MKAPLKVVMEVFASELPKPLAIICVNDASE